MSAMTQSRAPESYTPDRPRKADGAGRGNIFVYLIAALVVAFTLGPVLYGVLAGFRTNTDLSRNPSGWPEVFTFDNYKNILTGDRFWGYAFNSTMIALITTAIVVVAGLMAAYPLARYQFRLREPLYLVFVMGLLFPVAVAVIPLFIMISNDLGWGDTWWGVALPQAAFALPTTIIILRPFLQALPKELEEAALIDGASRIGFFWRILLPLSGPGMVTVGVLAFVGSWNAYLLPLLLLRNDSIKTLPLGVADFSTRYATDMVGVFAYTSLAMIPALIFFLSLQNKIVNGLQGAVKG
ncbi:carbohydrate ABC transporter permease [Actinotalea fermentans]|uniref:Sugar ABC transporter permease n=1 Tax=Actinotalea fermentans TaxID=43671 RepID=A0A511YTA2_9CELL|nr:carbohydrate ABC transporter permease [Actinotalea fermentans]KGM17127.1 thiamine ABC transporter ATP-binding protein [Actinotalea fermentans ATCC 43279 = JCM 9966 = DSM 3133]GEN78424.1 sugar ABC transporter permease [Actinotalea fermentans]